MKRLALIALMAAFTAGGLQGSNCSAQLAGQGFPETLKMRKKPRRARWQPVERALTNLRDGLAGTDCEARFKDVFEASEPDFFFPLLNNLLRTVPEESLVGAGVYSQDGSRMGEFANRVKFERNGNVLYYFQFKDRSGQLQSSGNRLLIDIESGKPLFQLLWSEIADRSLFDGQAETER